MGNDKGRGFKVMQLYRIDCGSAPTAEMRIAQKDGKARCVYGGKLDTRQRDSGAGYVTSVETARWTETGRGDYGPMKAMMSGRRQFKGPKMEAMNNLTPFENFLHLAARVRAAPRAARRRRSLELPAVTCDVACPHSACLL